MPSLEIERKFLVRGDSWQPADRVVRCVQGYLRHGPPVSVRIRTMDEVAFLTIKHGSPEPPSDGAPATRAEFEYPLPHGDAQQMLATMCSETAIEKTRHYLDFAGMTWEIDVFEGRNAGLIVAEVELSTVDQDVELPPWVGAEVTADPRYLNANLSQAPYDTWARG